METDLRRANLYTIAIKIVVSAAAAALLQSQKIWRENSDSSLSETVTRVKFRPAAAGRPSENRV